MNEVLIAMLRKRLDAAAWTWLEKALASAKPPVQANTWLGYFSGASRRVGKRALEPADDEAARLRAIDPELHLALWGADEAARALLLLALIHLPADAYAELVARSYELGDSREQQSVLRCLSLLPRPERFVGMATDACRTNILPLFEAIACENPYPLRCFPELNFNQLVLKALFNGVAIERIVGLEARANPELSRMAFDYLCEREAASRAVPADIWLALVPHADPGCLPRVLPYLERGTADQRYWLTVALGASRSAEGKAALEAQLSAESDPRIGAAIKASLQRMAPPGT